MTAPIKSESGKLSLNLLDTQDYAEALFPMGDIHLRSLAPGNGGGFKHYCPQGLDLDWIIEQNAEGRDVFAVINGGGQKKNEINQIRAFFIDYDEPGTGPERVKRCPFPPSMSIETSPGNYHYYWIIEDYPHDGDTYDYHLKALIKFMGSDPKADGRARIMRVPGLLHGKSGELSVLRSCTGQRYSWQEFGQWLQAGIEPEQPPEQRQPPRTMDGATTGNNYANKALDDGLHQVATAPEGGRNATLNKQACALFGLVKGGYLDKKLVEDNLASAANSAGLASMEVDRTLRSAWQGADRRTIEPASRGRNEQMAGLSALAPIDQEMQIKALSKELDVPVGAIRKELKQYEQGEQEADGQSVVEELQPWQSTVDGNALALSIREQIQRHAVLQEHSSTALVLWLFASYGIDCFRVFPRININSPEKRCGKSTLLECIEGFSFQAMVTASITPAALFRCIDAYKPTLLIDEVDTFLASSDELRGIVNSGHTKRTAVVIRTVGDDHEPKKFSTWTPMVLAGIKNPPDTIKDRSIVVAMQRATAAEKASLQALPGDHYEHSQDTRAQLLRWMGDSLKDVRKAAVEVVLPSIENSRAMDNWRPLFAAARVLGGDWPAECEKAYIAANQSEIGEGTTGEMLLSDLRDHYIAADREFLSTKEILERLNSLDERPWSEWSRGSGMNGRSLSNQLRHYKVKSHQQWFKGANVKGYRLSEMNPIFSRYLPPLSDAEEE